MRCSKLAKGESIMRPVSRVVRNIINVLEVKCPNEDCKQLVSEYDVYCKSCGNNFSGCVLTGASIFDHHYFL